MKRYLAPPYDCRANVGFIPNYVQEMTVDQEGHESLVIRQLSDEEYIAKQEVPTPEGVVVEGVANPDRLSRLQAIDEIEKRIDAADIKSSKSE